MIVEIPDEKIVAWAGCAPNTPIKEVIIIINNQYGRYLTSFYGYVGEHVIANAKELK